MADEAQLVRTLESVRSGNLMYGLHMLLQSLMKVGMRQKARDNKVSPDRSKTNKKLLEGC